MIFLDHAGAPHYQGLQHILNRFQLYFNIVQTMGQELDVKDYDELLIIPEIYQFAFRYSSGTIVNKGIQNHITLQM